MFKNILYILTKQLYPTGRAFRIFDGSLKEKLNKGLIISEDKAYQDGLSILNDILADNDKFLENAAADWERRLGMITNPLVALEDRKAAIRRKYQAPGVQPAHGHYLYLQTQLRKAGFDVYIFENRFPAYPDGYTTISPFDLTGDSGLLSEIQHGGVLQHGDTVEMGGYYNNIIVNSLDPAVDALFNLGGSFRSTFFIGGSPVGSFADVDAERETEFRQLILNIKQAQDVGFLFINYI